MAQKILGCLDLPARTPPLGSAPVESVGQDRESCDEDPPWPLDQTPPDGYGTQ
jgi:hypothetical protein